MVTLSAIASYFFLKEKDISFSIILSGNCIITSHVLAPSEEYIPLILAFKPVSLHHLI